MVTITDDTDHECRSSSEDLKAIEKIEKIPADDLLQNYPPLLEKMEKLWDLGIRPDLTITCKDGIQFQVHKAYVCGSSKHYWAETCSEKSKFHHLTFPYNSDLVAIFLLYAYTSQLIIKDNIDILNLFRFAAKSGLDKLKTRVAEAMATKLSPRNVVKYYFLGRRYYCVHLRRKAMCYFNGHYQEVFDITDWDKEYPQTAALMKRLHRSRIAFLHSH